MRPITTDIVGAQERFDQRESMFSQAAAGRADHPLIKRWLEVEPPDFLLRALMGIPRGENSVLHHLMAAADGPVNPSPAPLPEPAVLSRKIKALASFCGADLVGICRLDPAYVASHRGDEYSVGTPRFGEPIVLEHRFAVALAFARDYAMVRAGHSYIDGNDGAQTYNRAAVTACQLAGVIREMGYPAKAHHERSEEILQVPVAVAAGLGELGRLGMLITPRYGPRVRLAAVTTDLPLVPDEPVDIGVQAFCRICRKCAACCPSGAIAKGGQIVVRGVRKWVIRPVNCLAFWGADKDSWDDCSTCIAVCPYNRPDDWFTRLHHRPWFFMGLKQPSVGRLMLLVDDLLRGARPNPRVRWLDFRNDRPAPPAR